MKRLEKLLLSGAMDAHAAAREHRLFAVACARNSWMFEKMHDGAEKWMIVAGERYADSGIMEFWRGKSLFEFGASSGNACALENPRTNLWMTIRNLEVPEKTGVELFHCIFTGKEHASSVADHIKAWQNGLIVATANVIYEKRDWKLLPVLADMLEDAGETRMEVLEHCRKKGVHGRGCWVVDAILGRR